MIMSGSLEANGDRASGSHLSRVREIPDIKPRMRGILSRPEPYLTETVSDARYLSVIGIRAARDNKEKIARIDSLGRGDGDTSPTIPVTQGANRQDALRDRKTAKGVRIRFTCRAYRRLVGKR